MSRIDSRPPFVVIVDSRESVPFRFPPSFRLTMPDGSHQTRLIETRVEAMRTGDYTTPMLRLCGAIERKSASDAASTFTANRERFDREVRRMRLLRYRAIVVEGCWHDVLEVSPGFHRNSLGGAVASFWARAEVPTFFCGCADDAARVTLGLLRRWQEEEMKRASRMRFWMARRRAA